MSQVLVYVGNGRLFRNARRFAEKRVTEIAERWQIMKVYNARLIARRGAGPTTDDRASLSRTSKAADLS
jgi:hypothetical protein